MDVLWLTEEDVSTLLNMDDAILAVEKAFLDHGRGQNSDAPQVLSLFSKGRRRPAHHACLSGGHGSGGREDRKCASQKP